MTGRRRQRSDLKPAEVRQATPSPDAGRKKAPYFRTGLLHLIDAWQFPTLAWGDPTLPSALRRFTSEFGMGSGGTTALQPPGKFLLPCPVSFGLMPRCLSAKSSGLTSAEQNHILIR